MGRGSNNWRFELTPNRMSMRDQLGVRLIRMTQELRLQGLACLAAFEELAAREIRRALTRPPSA